MHFTLRQLEIFAAIARHGSVSAAAGEVALTQSAASTALGELERQTGRQLFDRVGKSLRLNELGRGLLPKAIELLDRAAEIDDLLLGHEAIGSLKVGATLTIGNYLATLIVAEFLQRYPQARLRLEVRNTATLIDARGRSRAGGRRLPAPGAGNGALDRRRTGGLLRAGPSAGRPQGIAGTSAAGNVDHARRRVGNARKLRA